MTAAALNARPLSWAAATTFISSRLAAKQRRENKAVASLSLPLSISFSILADGFFRDRPSDCCARPSTRSWLAMQCISLSLAPFGKMPVRDSRLVAQERSHVSILSKRHILVQDRGSNSPLLSQTIKQVDPFNYQKKLVVGRGRAIL